MASPLANMAAAFRIPDLRKRILFVLFMFGVFVIGLHIPIPNVNHQALNELMSKGGGSLLGLFDVFSGGAFRKFSVLAMSITPYINASIIFQLLGVAVPGIARLVKEGPSGQRKIAQYTRYLTVVLAIFQAAVICIIFSRQNPPILNVSGFGLIPTILTLTAGTCFLMWMGNQIQNYGIGNGVSLVIFCGIMVRLPSDIEYMIRQVVNEPAKIFNVIFLFGIWVGTIALITFVQQGSRKIPIQHARRVIGNKIYGVSPPNLPIRVNTAGVIPIIFAISISLLPAQITPYIAEFVKQHGNPGAALTLTRIANFLSPGSSIFASGLYFLLVVFFTYFYTAISFNVAEVADNLKKSGGFIPGIRPGKSTEVFLDRILTRITLAGALFLGVIAIMQYHVGHITGINFSIIGGTSLLIVVGVALETMQQIEAHLVMRQYEGFIK
jgi:preprotein translocase subunit SecY